MMPFQGNKEEEEGRREQTGKPKEKKKEEKDGSSLLSFRFSFPQQTTMHKSSIKIAFLLHLLLFSSSLILTLRVSLMTFPPSTYMYINTYI